MRREKKIFGLLLPRQVLNYNNTLKVSYLINKESGIFVANFYQLKKEREEVSKTHTFNVFDWK